MIGLSLGLSLGNPVLRSGAWTPAALFSASESGDWFDPSDMTRMWQDTAGTAAVTAAGQTVKRISGQRGGITLANATGWTLSSSGGLWWLDASGASGFASTAPVDFTGSDEMFVCAGVRKTSDAATGTVVEHSPGIGSNNGAFTVWAPGGAASATYAFYSKGTVIAGAPTSSIFASPHSAVLSAQFKISTDLVRGYVNGVSRATTSADQGAGNFGNHTVYLGARNGSTNFLVGRVGPLILRGKLPSTEEQAAAEAWVNQRTGAF